MIFFKKETKELKVEKGLHNRHLFLAAKAPAGVKVPGVVVGVEGGGGFIQGFSAVL